MRLSTLIFCCLFGTCRTSNFYCVYQPRTLSIKEDNSVTVPCSYTYPENRRESQIIVTWGERNGLFCSSIRKHITDGSGNIKDEYKDRISIEKHPEKNRTESLLIRGVKPSDGVTFCCRVTELRISGQEYTWNDNFGTSINFTELNRLYQVEELMAVPGEEMIIPCHYPVKTLQDVQKVTWYISNGVLCDNYTLELYRWDPTYKYERHSLVNFPESFSLRIHSVRENEHQRYCCRVEDKNRQYRSRFPTELTIAGPPSSSAPFSVTQPQEISGRKGQSVTLNCSYSGYKESDVLGVNIYWRLGNISGPYVYHPYKEMVHPSYKERAKITGASDLHIRGLQPSDDSMYYCFVMLKVCMGNDDYERLIQYGNGTRLIITDKVQTPSSLHWSSVTSVLYIGCKLLFALALLVLALVTYKDTR